MQTITFEITEERTSFLRAAVDSGRYGSEAEALQVAFERWQRWEQKQQLKLQALNAALEEGRASGIAEGTVEEIFERVMARAGLGRQAA